MKLDGEITICRVTGALEEYVSIKVRDERARLEFVEVIMDLEAFGSAILGRGFTPCRLEVRGLEHVGKRMEHESRNVRVPAVPYHERKQAAAAAVQAEEHDGWRGRVEDAMNHHNIASRDEDGEVYSVSFTRYVDAGQEG